MKALRFVLVVVVLIGTQRAVSSQPSPDRPALVSATYWGGSLSEEFAAVAVDAAGNVYVAGTTASARARPFGGPLAAVRASPCSSLRTAAESIRTFRCLKKYVVASASHPS